MKSLNHVHLSATERDSIEAQVDAYACRRISQDSLIYYLEGMGFDHESVTQYVVLVESTLGHDANPQRYHGRPYVLGAYY